QTSIPIVYRTPGGGGQQLGATHSQNIEVWYAHMPGLKVVAPSNPADAKALLSASIRDDDPVLFLANLNLYNTKGEVPDDERRFELSTAASEYSLSDLVAIYYTRGVGVALKVAEWLTNVVVSIEVVDLRSHRQLDRPSFCRSVARTNKAVV